MLFNETFTKYKNENWNFVYTDGSKTSSNVAFAVVDENGLTKVAGLLPQNATIFEAEAEAIVEALNLCKLSPNKNIICTDSRSVFDAALNPRNRNEIIISIQQLLIQMKEKAKLLWIPSHIGIMGNEAADKAAKDTHLHPTFLFIPKTKNFISRSLISNLNASSLRKWNNYDHPYKNINPDKKPIHLPTSTNWHKNKCFTRLRLTHTRLTHQYLMSRDSQPLCTYCNNSTQTIIHLLSDCPSLHNIRLSICNSSNIVDLLKCPSDDNVNKIYEFLQHLNIHNEI